MDRFLSEAGCAVCGNPETVRSHIVPRSIALDVRGGDIRLEVGEQGRAKAWPSQNGVWDRALLCEAHERALNDADTYGVAFTRLVYDHRYSMPDEAEAWIPNGKPDLLAKFAASCVWRFVNSRYGRQHGLSLGPYNQVLIDHLFGNGPTRLPLIVTVTPLIDPNGNPAPVLTMPYRTRFLELNTWVFQLNTAQFFLIVDQRKPDPRFDPVRADFANPLRLVTPPPMHVTNWRGWSLLSR